ncbi:cytochrome P450 27C1-like [Mya arenaria]|uniref:cytochrome P450 27C1-like n=1 Tax=Mya arenaria TaxID=6604 RepID=UPI0022DFCBE2|nr:cytochrome P450 27C1-like [Mya arenaria]
MENLRLRGDEADVMALLQRSLSNIVYIAISGEVIPEGDEDEDMFWNIVDANLYFLANSRITTTWSILSSTIFLLLYHPEFQDRLAKELQEIVKQGEEATSRDKVKSPLMEALELETHRLLLVNPTLLSRVASKDFEYEGYTIIEGTMPLLDYDPRQLENLD